MRKLEGSVLCLVLAAVVAVACGSSADRGFGNDQPDGGPGVGPSITPGQSCVDGRICVGQDIYTCGADGLPTKDKLGDCYGADQACLNGACKSGCEAVASTGSNVGCEFWAVDLDNEFDGTNDAAGAAWGVVIANPGGQPADVVIEQNDAPVGQPAKITIAKHLLVSSGQVETVSMPTREVDGSLMGKNEGPGTVLSSRAFRITTSAPVVVYQLNALAQTFSNDGSLLLPKNGLGKVHRVLAYPTGNPISILGLPLSRAYITVVGVEADTTVTIKTSTPTVFGPGYPALAKDGEVKVKLGPFDVFNLESDGLPGDFSGSIVVADRPIVVFTGTELSGSPNNTKDIPHPPGSTSDDTCCLDHLEEQLFPVESYGKRFAIPHSAVRSTSGYIEPDVIRIMGVATTASVKTNLAPPNDAFTVAPGEVRETWTQKDFVLEATEPVAVAQILVSQQQVDGAYTGDPSLTIFPAVDQFRRNYLFAVPKSWDTNTIVISMPKGTNVTIDGAPLPGTCKSGVMGTVAGTDYESRSCALVAGPHAMVGDKPFGITAYGYGRAGSYAFVGGANVTKIYEPPVIR
jgi:IgGFc binding protein